MSHHMAGKLIIALGQLHAATCGMMAGVTVEEESFTFESTMQGCHVFERILMPVNGQLLLFMQCDFYSGKIGAFGA